MKIQKYKDIEYSEVRFNELYGDMRVDAQYYDPFFIRNERIIKKKPTKYVSSFMHQPQYGISIAMNEVGIGYKMLKMDDIVGIFASDENAKYADITEETFENFELKKFDVLFNRVNSDEFVGRTGIYLLDGEHTFASYLVRITSDKTYANCYLTIFLNCKYGYNCLQRVKRRAVNQANINAQELKALEIPFPSDKLQKQIEKLVVEAYNQKLHSQTIYQEAETTLLKELCLDDWQPKTVKFKIKNVEYETEDAITEIDLYQALQADRIDPEYWEQKYLELECYLKSQRHCYFGNILSIRRGDYIDTSYYNEFEGNPYLRIKELSLDVIINKKEIIYLEDFTGLEEQHLKNEDFIFAAIGATLGKINLIRQDLDSSYYSNNTARFRYIMNAYKKKVLPNFLIIYFQSFLWQMQITRRQKQTAQAKINDRDIRTTIIPLVKGSIQSKIDNLVKESLEAIKKSKQLLETAKRAVEIFIEEDEQQANKFIDKSLKT
ncbi:MAG: hypothetical protein FVQ77_06325 [Cytophagales bacterium]|nr:hypothetical protein [Cytophagales bacterium]